MKIDGPEKLKRFTDKVYKIGTQHGRISMKNDILKNINQDWKLIDCKSKAELIIKVLKKIDKIK